MGSQGTTSLLTPQQQQYFSGALGSGIGGQSGQAYSQFLQGQSPQEMQSAFQTGVVDPMQQIYNQQIVPGIQQRFTDANASSSSALNQALGQSAQDLTTSLGSQYLPFMQGQQQNTLSALGQLGSLAGHQTMQPYQQGGISGQLIGALGNILGAYLGVPGSQGNLSALGGGQ